LVAAFFAFFAGLFFSLGSLAFGFLVLVSVVLGSLAARGADEASLRLQADAVRLRWR
jgi:hypothetical protein